MNGRRNERSQLRDLHFRKGGRSVGCLSTLTDKSVGVALLAATSAMGPGGGGTVCSKCARQGMPLNQLSRYVVRRLTKPRSGTVKPAVGQAPWMLD